MSASAGYRRCAEPADQLYGHSSECDHHHSFDHGTHSSELNIFNEDYLAAKHVQQEDYDVEENEEEKNKRNEEEEEKEEKGKKNKKDKDEE